MSFGHERLDIYRAAMSTSVGCITAASGSKASKCEGAAAPCFASDRCSVSLKATAKATDGARRRYFEIARGSALERGAIQDVLEACGALSPEENAEAKAALDRIVAMLTSG